MQSPIFQAMLSLPQGGNKENMEGQSDDNPIVLHGIVRQEFDHLLCYLHGHHGGSNSEQERQEFLISVLKLSDLYQIDTGFQFAVSELKRTSPVPLEPSLKLKLGRQYRIHEWVEPAFHAMMERPVLSITRFEAHQMGMEFFWILVTTKAKIEEHYRALAYTEPPLDQSGNLCELHRHVQQCGKTSGGVSNIIALLEGTDFDGGICSTCKTGIILKLMDSPALQFEEAHEDIAAVLVMDYQMDG
ncbi:hypothetical protein J3R83DRAFT_7471 [Lanmaoa asiatica]|nr:hypothetical protein J3R83DRAFT_7471 [Lanmaoa asiatica]